MCENQHNVKQLWLCQAQAVDRRPITTGNLVRSWAFPSWMYGGKSGPTTSFPPSISFCPGQYNFNNVPEVFFSTHHRRYVTLLFYSVVKQHVCNPPCNILMHVMRNIHGTGRKVQHRKTHKVSRSAWSDLLQARLHCFQSVYRPQR